MAANIALIQSALATIGQNPLDVDLESGESRIKGAETDPYITAANFWLVELLGLAAVISGTISFFLLMTFSLFVVVASLFVVGLGFVIAYQKTILKSLGGIRGQNVELRTKVHKFHDENIRLGASIDEITKQARKLETVKDELDKVSKASGKSVNRLVEIVAENGHLQKEIVEKLEAEVMMQLMTAVLQTDLNRDFVLSPDEVNILVFRLASIPGVVFDEAAFRKLLSTDEGELTLSDACEIARNLHETEQTVVQAETDKPASSKKKAEPVFEFRPSDLLKN